MMVRGFSGISILFKLFLGLLREQFPKGYRDTIWTFPMGKNMGYNVCQVCQRNGISWV